MSTSKPTIVVCPGAWHIPKHYELLTNVFKEAGFASKCSQMPSVGFKNLGSIDCTEDANNLRDHVIMPVLDGGKDLVLVVHSYGGLVGSAASKGLSKSEREAEGKEGGIVGLVWIAAFIPKEGDSLLHLVGGTHPAWLIADDEEDSSEVEADRIIELFYHDVCEPTALKAKAELQRHSVLAQSSPVGPPGWQDSAFDGRRGYIVTKEDAALPTAYQHVMIENSGVKWDVREMNTSHSPFLSKPKETMEVIVEMIEGFA